MLRAMGMTLAGVVLLAGPAWAMDRDDAIAATANARMPACALPVAQLSIGDIERCRRNLAWAREVYDRFMDLGTKP
jgi:hypothetical protein